jgi:hypothetical protein
LRIKHKVRRRKGGTYPLSLGRIADGRSIAPVVVPIQPAMARASSAAQTVHAYQSINALVIASAIPQQLNWIRSGTGFDADEDYKSGVIIPPALRRADQIAGVVAVQVAFRHHQRCPSIQPRLNRPL